MYAITVPAECELVAVATTTPRPDCDVVMLGTVSIWYKFMWKFADGGLMIVHSVGNTSFCKFPIKIANLEERTMHLQRGQRVPKHLDCLIKESGPLDATGKYALARLIATLHLWMAGSVTQTPQFSLVIYDPVLETFVGLTYKEVVPVMEAVSVQSAI